jgi:hypothetical protein
MRTVSLASIVLPLVLLVPATARAQHTPRLPPPPTVVVAIEDPTAHLHDGFYLRLANGFGSHYEDISLAGHDPGVTVSGVSSVGELALGYALWPGWVVGLGSYSGTLVVTSRTFHTDQPMPPADLLNDVKDFNVFGPFCDHYFDPRGGLHLQGAIGLATMRGVGIASTHLDEDHIVVGAGVMLGIGYDWWVADQWSIGILGRVTAASSTSDDEDGLIWRHGVSAAPSLLFTATYN